ncbi:hypothetical protein ILYODFUR_036858, partial [Ilyodon furcidens]
YGQSNLWIFFCRPSISWSAVIVVEKGHQKGVQEEGEEARKLHLQQADTKPYIQLSH